MGNLVHHTHPAPANRLQRAATIAVVLITAITVTPRSAHAGDCQPAWTAGVGLADSGMALSFATLDDGSALTHYLGWSGGVARWAGAAWEPVGEGTLIDVNALAVFDDGSGPTLYAAPLAAILPTGAASGPVRWDGTAWQKLGTGLGGAATAEALVVFGDGTGPALYVGGHFTTAGGYPAVNIARWDGAQWSAVTGGSGVLGSAVIRALTVFDDGTGPALYVGGNNITVNGVVTNVARWNGTTWSAVLGAPQEGNTIVLAMTAFDDGTGPALYACGMSSPNPALLPIVTRYDGAAWSTVGPTFNGSLHALAAFDDGTGPALYVAGAFSATYDNGVETPLSRIAKRNGTQWQAVGNGVNTNVQALAPTLDLLAQQTPALLVGGSFATAGGMSSPLVAEWRRCPYVLGDLNCDGNVDFGDIDPFVIALSGPAAYYAAYPNCNHASADANGDGNVDFGDIDSFVAVLSAP